MEDNTMINPTDKKYPIDPKNPDDKRPAITTFDEYMEIALNAALGAAMNLDKNGWNEQIQKRYDSNKGIGVFVFHIQNFKIHFF